MSNRRHDPLDGAEPFDEFAAYHLSIQDEIDEAAFEEDLDYADYLAAFESAAPLGEIGADHQDSFAGIIQQVCDIEGVNVLPHPSEAGRLKGSTFSREALRAGAAAQAILDACSDETQRRVLIELADAAADAAFFLAAHKVEHGVLKQYETLRANYDRLLNGMRQRAKHASQHRERHDWKERASELWRRHPTWKTHRVAKAIAQAGEDISSISRAIKPLKPEE